MKIKDGYYWVSENIEHGDWIIVFISFDDPDPAIEFLGTAAVKPPSWLIGKSFVGPLQVPVMQVCAADTLEM